MGRFGRGAFVGACGAVTAAIVAVGVGVTYYFLDDSALQSGRDFSVPASLAGYNVIITGSTRGIGLAAAKEFCRLGAHVVVSGRSQEAAESAAVEVRAAAVGGQGQATPLAVDLTDFKDVRRFASETAAALGRVHVLILNAGIALASQAGHGGFEEIYSANYLGHFLLTELLLPSLSEGATIISMSSYGMFHGFYEALMSPEAYVATLGMGYHNSKLALMCYTRSLRRRLVGRVSVQMLVPGRVATDLHGGAQHHGGRLYLWFAPPSQSAALVVQSAFTTIRPTPDVLYAFWFPRSVFQRYVPIANFGSRFKPSLLGPTLLDLAEYFQRLTYGLHASVGPECGQELHEALRRWSANWTGLGA